jgi:lipopolysaccharide export system permease protein
MKNKIYKYFFHEFLRYFTVVLFAISTILWTVQAVNFLDLVTNDGHAFVIYFYYSLLTVPKILTKLIPFTFLIALMLTILKFEKDNELIVLWTSGLNKIHLVNLVFKISVIIMFLQLIMSSLINPQTLNYSRNLIKNSKLEFVPSLLKEKQFNDTVEFLTIFVEKKNEDGTYEGIFIRDEGKILTDISSGSSTIFAKSGYVTTDEKNLILMNGNIQKLEEDKSISVIKFEKTSINLSGLDTKTISEPKIQETSTIKILECIKIRCVESKKNFNNYKIEINKRFGMPIFIPLIGLIICFLLSLNRNKKNFEFHKYLYFFTGFIVIVFSEIAVRYSGSSWQNAAIYYIFPILLLPLIYFILIKKFKYENLI